MLENSIKLTMVSESGWLKLRTWDNVHGASRWFAMHRDNATRALEGVTVVDADIDGFVQIFRRDNDVLVRLWWLDSVIIGDVTGYTQAIIMPTDVFAGALRDNKITVTISGR